MLRHAGGRSTVYARLSSPAWTQDSKREKRLFLRYIGGNNNRVTSMKTTAFCFAVSQQARWYLIVVFNVISYKKACNRQMVVSTSVSEQSPPPFVTCIVLLSCRCAGEVYIIYSML